MANELFIATLSAGAEAIEVTLAATGDDLKITAATSERLFLRHSHGPGWRIINGLSRITGITADEHAVWARLSAGADT
ncbi:hypothetical protein ACGFY9_13800 [Streptomyces sp. NPDC048504]|uniref:hypothetical protein n=1 Tax=Streptomyces sp. NPDC048504 TaxID=3365559 RepID=UPI00371D50F2